MIVGLFKKALGIKDSDNKDKEIVKKPSTKERFHQTLNLIEDKVSNALSESQIVREKLKDLQKTNYDLAIEHLRNGNIKEAIFRFKIVRKFWPQNYAAHLDLIYCYLILDEEENANDAIDYLLYLEPELELEIERLKVDASFNKVDIQQYLRDVNQNHPEYVESQNENFDLPQEEMNVELPAQKDKKLDLSSNKDGLKLTTTEKKE